MITIQSVVQKILQNNIEARVAMGEGYMNYSRYADKIIDEVEMLSKKAVTRESVIMALSRLGKEDEKDSTLSVSVTVAIKNLTTKSPLTEISYEKNQSALDALQKLFSKVKPHTDDFFTLTYSTGEISVTCSDRLVSLVEKQFKNKPILITRDLASLGIALDDTYYPMSGITYSLIKKIATRNIPLAETITSHTEIIFTFDKKYLGEMVEIFS